MPHVRGPYGWLGARFRPARPRIVVVMRLRTVLAIIISLAIVFGAVEAAIYLAHHNRYGQPIIQPAKPAS
jgi:hypothetical protein